MKIGNILITIILAVGVGVLLVIALQNFGILKSSSKGQSAESFSLGGMPGGSAGNPGSEGKGISASGDRPPIGVPGQGTGEKIYAVSSIRVARGSLRDYIKLNGEVTAKSSVDVAPDKAGRLSRLYVNIGDRVVKNQIVAEVDPSTSGNQLAPLPIRAPIGGTVTSINGTIGQLVNAGTSILSMSEVMNVEVKAFVPERYIGKIKVQSEAEAVFDAYPGVVFKFRVATVSPVVDAASRTMKISLEPVIPDARIKAGMFAKITIITEIRNNVMLIPADGILSDDEGEYVYAIDEAGTVNRRNVSVGLVVDGTAEIREGLSTGEEIAVEGTSMLAEGARVRVVSRLEPLQNKHATVFPVMTAVAARRNIGSYIRTNGVVTARTSVDVLADVSGKVTQLLVQIGDRVEKGQVVAEVDPSKPGTEYVANRVKAPISGIVTQISVQVGASLASTSVPLMTISRTDDLQVKAEVSERNLANLKVGQQADFSLDAYPDVRFSGKLSDISPEVKSSTQTVEVRITPVPMDDRIKAGMFAQIGILIDSSSNTVAVPREALIASDSGYSAYVVGKNSAAERRSVIPGVMGDTLVEIKSGIAEGEEVIVRGYGLISDGSKVDVVERLKGDFSGTAFRGVAK